MIAKPPYPPSSSLDRPAKKNSTGLIRDSVMAPRRPSQDYSLARTAAGVVCRVGRKPTTESWKRGRRGRPALVEGDVSTPVCVRLSTTQYDATDAHARRDRVSIPDVLRRALRQYLEHDPDD